MKSNTIILFIFIFGLTNVFSQKQLLKRIDNDYDNYSYVKTSDILRKVAEKGYESSELYQKLGNSYYFNNEYEQAAKWYGKLMVIDKTIDPEYYFRYSQTLKALKEYDKADTWMQKFTNSKPMDSRSVAFKSKPYYLEEIDERSNYKIKIRNLDFNSTVSDFGTVIHNDKIVYASARGKGKLYNWNEQPYLDLYSVFLDEQGNYTVPKKLGKEINTQYHESSASYTPDGNIMYFTRNNYYKNRLRIDDKDVNRLQMFIAYRDSEENWEKVVPVHFNSDQYSVSHPSVNADGTKLYFASDMPGTHGKSDIYVVDINKDGTLGVPINLGEVINTESKETFPFINTKGDLYFSSNGHPGLGGLDIFVIKNFESKVDFGSLAITNRGRPINSSMDDFAYYENINAEEGYFSSNREGGNGGDDIYSFKTPKCEQLLNVNLRDEQTNKLLTGATVTIFDKKGNRISEKITNQDGIVLFELECDIEYLIRIYKGNYITTEKRITIPDTSKEQEMELFLEKDKQKIGIGYDLAKVLDISVIYFDFNKFNIRYDAEVELQKVLVVLNDYPNMKIDIRSHTDCRGTDRYNEVLSTNRARSTMQYLIDKGITPDRLSAKGYGERELIKKCDCGDNSINYCSEKDHQLNRRSEFIIISK
ncbi:hypothetical protein AB832_02375 [Flavobacteriaceae bacterium (ex Bugula neritina AB1)]|nr:hypothetical protein AB832_02375 [Flavobacteriaceae bacterium (ex Bugula neritina AB1)]